jgi:hypothetical protein
LLRLHQARKITKATTGSWYELKFADILAAKPNECTKSAENNIKFWEIY